MDENTTNPTNSPIPSVAPTELPQKAPSRIFIYGLYTLIWMFVIAPLLFYWYLYLVFSSNTQANITKGLQYFVLVAFISIIPVIIFIVKLFSRKLTKKSRINIFVKLGLSLVVFVVVANLIGFIVLKPLALILVPQGPESANIHNVTAYKTSPTQLTIDISISIDNPKLLTESVKTGNQEYNFEFSAKLFTNTKGGVNCVSEYPYSERNPSYIPYDNPRHQDVNMQYHLKCSVIPSILNFMVEDNHNILAEKAIVVK